MKVMTFNVHHAEGYDPNSGVPAWQLSIERIAEVILAEAPDVVAVQELDRFWHRSGDSDQPARLAELLGMNYVFAPNLTGGPDADSDRDHEYGIGTFTPHPIVQNRHSLLPIEDGWEPRGALGTTIDVPHIGTVTVINAHLQSDSLGRSARAQRVDQAQVVAATAEKAGGPTVVMGDFNAEVGDAELDALLGPDSRLTDAWAVAGKGSGLTVPLAPRNELQKRIDLILVSPDFQVEGASVVITPTSQMASDHYPVAAELRVGATPGGNGSRQPA